MIHKYEFKISSRLFEFLCRNIITFVGMDRIVLIGGGNVAWHLQFALKHSPDFKVIQIYNRTLESIKDFKFVPEHTDDLSNLKEAEFYIICVSDHAIEEISQAIEVKKGLIVHTSGATPMNVLSKHGRIGVFYPLQSFNKNKLIKYKNIPICIESNTKLDAILLKKLSKVAFGKAYFYNSEQRKKIHVAAVFVNNFVNHLYYLGYNYLENNAIKPEILYPLIKETALKIKKNHPLNSQTGPALRNDFTTFDAHLEILDKSIQKEIYKLISNSISDIYGHKL